MDLVAQLSQQLRSYEVRVAAAPDDLRNRTYCLAASKHPCVHVNSRCVQTYVDGKMTIQELKNYDCVEATGKIVPEYWGNFSGPCCKPKSSLHSGLDPSRA